MRRGHAAFQLTLRIAIVVSFSFVSFSSSRFCCSTDALSPRPGIFAQAIRRSITRDFIMLNGLGRGNQRGVKHVLVVDFARNVTGFFEDAVDRGTINALACAVHLEYLFEAGDLIIRFLKVLFEAVLQGRISCFWRPYPAGSSRSAARRSRCPAAYARKRSLRVLMSFGKKLTGFLLWVCPTNQPEEQGFLAAKAG